MPPLLKRPYDDEYLLAHSRHHLSYEIDMFLGLAAARDSAAMQFNNEALAIRLQNAVLEATVLHLRNLLEFLFCDDPRGTDVVASDYYSDVAWKDIRPGITGPLKRARFRANKEMAHLTTSRLDPADERRAWNIPALRTEILPVLRAFVDHAESSRLDPAVAETLELAAKDPGAS